ncbi:hypothetical protein NDN08_004530 [Rhodosorus marinus]|uniref:RNA polymerase sigma-70 domain-containing protein n=1 Tax=Rhodosorus marinus TaxID=101924 RepID=A0AAV8UQ38_9RHOD|nr:hypothetical protein NDN08_004530 [Rhodosorus marinus]
MEEVLGFVGGIHGGRWSGVEVGKVSASVATCVLREASVGKKVNKVGKRPRPGVRKVDKGVGKQEVGVDTGQLIDFSKLEDIDGWASDGLGVGEEEKKESKTTAQGTKKQSRRRKDSEKQAETPVFYRDSLKSYMSEIRRVDILKRSEEVDLARKIQACVKLEDCKARLQVSLGRNPTFKEWADDAKLDVKELNGIIISGTSAKQALVSANLRLVHSVVNKSSRSHGLKDASQRQDLMQEGVFGLMRAAEKYDADKGFRFSTYATYWVMSFTSRALQTIDRPVKVPTRVMDSYMKMKKLHREYVKAHRSEPSEKELAKLVGVTAPKLRTIIESVNQKTISTDLHISGEAEGATIGDLLEDDSDIDENLVEDMFRKDFDRALKKYLNPRERAAIRLRYGLDDGGERTLKQISKVLKVSAERTRQIIFGAIVKLRNQNVLSDLREYVPDVKDVDPEI